MLLPLFGYIIFVDFSWLLGYFPIYIMLDFKTKIKIPIGQ